MNAFAMRKKTCLFIALPSRGVRSGGRSRALLLPRLWCWHRGCGSWFWSWKQPPWEVVSLQARVINAVATPAYVRRTESKMENGTRRTLSPRWFTRSGCLWTKPVHMEWGSPVSSKCSSGGGEWWRCAEAACTCVCWVQDWSKLWS